MEIELKPIVGSFAENKDIAKDIRLKQIMPALEKQEKVIVDFTGVDSNANDDIQEIISIVYRYLQESMDGEAGGIVNDISRIYRR